MHAFVNADASRLPFADDTFDLTFTSPPYIDARTYGIRAQRDCAEWIEWMLGIVAECVRVTKGLVIINCAGVTRDWCYQPGPEGLLYEWWKRGGRCWRPAYWHRVGIPGSGGEQWLRADIEPILIFTKCEGRIPWSDNTANGHAPKWAPGGDMSYRNTEGTRRNQWGGGELSTGNERDVDGNRRPAGRPSHKMNAPGPSRRPNGKMKSVSRDAKPSEEVDDGQTEEEFFAPQETISIPPGQGGKDSMGFHEHGGRGRDKKGVKKTARRCTRGRKGGDTVQETMYEPPVLANPGVLVEPGATAEEVLAAWLASAEADVSNCIKWIKVGGGLMGHNLAHENEAPFPLKLAQWFIRGWCPPNGWILDPFSGSGTSVHAAMTLGRNAVGCDLRFSQCELGRRRCQDSQPELFTD